MSKSWKWLVFQIIALFCFAQIFGFLHYLPSGDEGSFLAFDFTSVRSTLSEHRTILLPLLMKVYQILFSDFYFWPYIQFFCYILAVLILYHSLLISGFSRINTFLIASSLLYSFHILRHCRYVGTEVLAVAFLILTVSFLIRIIILNERRVWLCLGFSMFLLWQTRPAMLFIVGLIPVLGVLLSYLCAHLSQSRKYLFLKLLVISFLPLVAFVGFRYYVTHHFGIVAFTGPQTSGHATLRLTEDLVEQLPLQYQAFSREVLKRKSKLTPPCNETFSFSKIGFMDLDDFNFYLACTGPNAMMSWLVAKEMLQGIKPFEDEDKNIEPWNYMYLSKFFSGDNIEVDRFLNGYNWSVLKLQSVDFLKWVFKAFVVCIYQSFIPSDYLILPFLFFLLDCIYRLKIFIRVSHEEKSKTDFEYLIFVFVAVGVFITGTVLVVFMGIPLPRYLDEILIFFSPVVVLRLSMFPVQCFLQATK